MLLQTDDISSYRPEITSRFRHHSAVAACVLFASIVCAQSLVSGFSSAQASVSNPTALLLDAVTTQLTVTVLDHISNDNTTKQLAELFVFESSSTFVDRPNASCKTSPGDDLWPSKSVWGIFDPLLDRRLISTGPNVLICYDSEWGTKILAKCNALVGRFMKVTTQYVFKS